MVSVAFSSAFHDASAGHDSLNFHTFELALKDVDGDTRDAADPAEERAGLAEPSKPARRGSVFMAATPPATPEAAADRLEGEQHIHDHQQQQQQQQQQAEPPPPPSSSAGKPAAAMYRQTSAHRLFRAAPPEPKRQQWKVCEETPLAGGAGACGVGCSHGFSPMRSRGAGHSMHGPSAGGGGVPYGFGGGRHGEHHNQPMVCVVVPAQRAAALGLAPHPPHGLHSTGKCTSRGTAPCDGHFSSLAQSSAASGGGGGHPGYASHTRSHSQPISHGGGSGGGGGGGGYGHHGGSPHGNFDHHHSGAAAGTSHHLSVSPSHHVSPSSSHLFSPSSGHHISPSSGHRVSPSAGRSYGGPPAMHMPPMPRERQGRAEPRDYPVGASGGGGGGSSPSFGEYERPSQSESHLHPAYALPEWGYDDAGGSGAGRVGGGAMATAHGVVRSQSPPPMVRSRNGGGAPRPPSASPRAYDGHYSSTRYNGRGGVEGFSVAGIGGASGGVATRRRSESSAMVGRSSIQRDALAAAASYYYAVDDMGKDDAAYGRDCRGSRGPASRLP